jgi:hypothetical protein
MPMKFCLEFMAVIGADRVNAKRKSLHHMIDEINCIGLGVALVNFQSSDSGGVINGCVLETSHLLAC